MNRKMIFEKVTAVLAGVRDRTRLANGRQAAFVQAAAVVPLTSGEMVLRPSKVLPGHMIMPLAWPVDEQHGRPIRDV